LREFPFPYGKQKSGLLSIEPGSNTALDIKIALYDTDNCYEYDGVEKVSEQV